MTKKLAADAGDHSSGTMGLRSCIVLSFATEE